MLEGFGLIFRIFSNFLGFLSHDSFFYRFFSIFHRFWMDFERILEGFWEGFSMILGIIIENSDFVKNSVFPRENQ